MIDGRDLSYVRWDAVDVGWFFVGGGGVEGGDCVREGVEEVEGLGGGTCS